MTSKNEMSGIETGWDVIANHRTTDRAMGLTQHFHTLGLGGVRGNLCEKIECMECPGK
jgi:hypothetical protein